MKMNSQQISHIHQLEMTDIRQANINNGSLAYIQNVDDRLKNLQIEQNSTDASLLAMLRDLQSQQKDLQQKYQTTVNEGAD